MPQTFTHHLNLDLQDITAIAPPQLLSVLSPCHATR